MAVFSFLLQFFINSADTVFPDIFISFDSDRKLKSTLFESALYQLPYGIGLLFLAVSSKKSFSLLFCEFVKFSLALLELMQLQCFQVFYCLFVSGRKNQKYCVYVCGSKC